MRLVSLRALPALGLACPFALALALLVSSRDASSDERGAARIDPARAAEPNLRRGPARPTGAEKDAPTSTARAVKLRPPEGRPRERGAGELLDEETALLGSSAATARGAGVGSASAVGVASEEEAERARRARAAASRSSAEAAAERAAAIARIRGALQSPDPDVRLQALVEARDLLAPELEPDIRALLEHERNVPVRRVAVQDLALGDVDANKSVFEGLARAPDGVVRINANFGLARGGDEKRQDWLVKVYNGALKNEARQPDGPQKEAAAALVTALERSLACPDLKSPTVVALFQSIADDPDEPEDVREAAREAVAAKLGNAQTPPSSP
jgi:hypothetical protein